MYDLNQFTSKDLAKCSLVLRQFGRDAGSMTEASRKIAKYIYEHFCDAETGAKSCALVRVFKTHPYRELKESLPKCFFPLVNSTSPEAEIKCWRLLAAAGTQPQWNSWNTVENTEIALMSEDFVAQIPMISELSRQLGLDIPTLLGIKRQMLQELEAKIFDVFYLSDAEYSPFVSEKNSLIIPYQVKSVLGFGGFLPSGNFFFVLMFLKIKIPSTTATQFKDLALGIKTALLPFDGGVVFEPSESHAYLAEYAVISVAQNQVIQLSVRDNRSVSVLTDNSGDNNLN